MRAYFLLSWIAACVVGLAGCGAYDTTGGGGGEPGLRDEAGPERGAARRDPASQRQLLDNLRAIARAMHSYHDAYKSFPTQAICDPNGNPLLSWRVALLPYLPSGGGASPKALYDQFRLDEPWDSPHNSQLVKRMPAVYSCGRAAGEGTTSIMVFVGEGTPFGGPKALSLADIFDGTSNTIFCVVAGADKAVPWTKPEDLTFDPNNPLASLGQISGDMIPAACFDGSVHQVLKSIDPDVLRLVICHADGKPVVFQ